MPWSDPVFSSVALAMIAFVFGGFGGAINAAYAMNGMVHNTAWIMGHFHVTLGTTVALTFMGRPIGCSRGCLDAICALCLWRGFSPYCGSEG